MQNQASRQHRTPTPLWHKGLLASAALIVSGCASASLDASSFQQGWRRATVVEVASAQATLASPAQTDCRVELGPDAGYTHYAVVSYSWGGSPKLRAKRIVAVPAGTPVKVGDTVKVHVVDCKVGLMRYD
jgi:hypothetical protein